MQVYLSQSEVKEETGRTGQKHEKRRNYEEAASSAAAVVLHLSPWICSTSSRRISLDSSGPDRTITLLDGMTPGHNSGVSPGSSRKFYLLENVDSENSKVVAFVGRLGSGGGGGGGRGGGGGGGARGGGSSTAGTGSRSSTQSGRSYPIGSGGNGQSGSCARNGGGVGTLIAAVLISLWMLNW
ncbi:hypothetical protein CDL15_Pgr022767 [Punica granatum]|uniref:Uncharacterized protein n=1 Tax=Punica granatum TaxID=22663 RepID=A0A218XRU0_PUNGR|nr:hypothetical protein CDL15_Pgr022767 [Punica granatum]